ncbi:MAG: type II secretion system protein N [Pseudomonadota bacterium]
MTGLAVSGAFERTLRHVAQIALLAVLGLIIARAIWFIAYGPEAWRADIAPAGAPTLSAQAVDRDLSALSRLDLFASRGGAVAESVLPETRLNLTLRGVRRGAEPSSGSAIIEAPARGQRSVPVGGEIADGVTLAQVYEDRVVIDRRGVRENLFLRDETARNPRSASLIQPVDEGQPDIPPQTAVPDLPDDWITALRLRRVDEGLQINAESGDRILDRFSLRRGDIITAVDGRPVRAGREALNTLEELEGADAALLTILRGGQTVQIQVSVR